MPNTKEKLSGSDRTWGFRFGIDGTASVEEAMGLMSVKKTKFYELVKARKIRCGKMERKTVVCRRSILEYLGSIEV